MTYYGLKKKKTKKKKKKEGIDGGIRLGRGI